VVPFGFGQIELAVTGCGHDDTPELKEKELSSTLPSPAGCYVKHSNPPMHALYRKAKDWSMAKCMSNSFLLTLDQE
jgi:hypothetical protein